MYRCDHCRGFMALGPHCDYPLCERCTRLAFFGVLVDQVVKLYAVNMGDQWEDWMNGLDAIAELIIDAAHERAAHRRAMNDEIHDGQREATAAFEDGRARERLGHTW